MKEMTTKDLKESLTLLLYHQEKDGAGGWKEKWKKGPQLWGSLWPIIGKNGFHERDEGGPMGSQCGYIHVFPPPFYRLVIRVGTAIPPKSQLLWNLRQHTKHLMIVNSPVFIQYHQFLCMTVVENKPWDNY